MKLVDKYISLEELKVMSEKMFNKIVKAVVDIKKEIMVVDAGLHSDQEAFLLEYESQQEDLWGINFHPHEAVEDFIEFDSMINIRPAQNNRTRSVDNPIVQEKIRKIIAELVTK